jgi:putative transposase
MPRPTYPYIPMRGGFVYLPAVMDWASRWIFAWRVSITLTTDFCLEAVEEALAKHGSSEISNADQGSQFTSTDFTDLLKAHRIAISMDGKGCWRDNVFVERFWKSIKYWAVYLHTYDNVFEARDGIGRTSTSTTDSRRIAR